MQTTETDQKTTTEPKTCPTLRLLYTGSVGVVDLPGRVLHPGVLQLGREVAEAQGIGLAAQQVGRAIQLCVVDLRETEAEFAWKLDGAKPPLELIMPMTIVNPALTIERGTDEKPYEEGCLSFPKIRGDVVRPDAITVKFQDAHGVPHELACDGLFARCIQHEADHLNGVLFIDRMDKKVRATIDEAVKALAKETRAAAKEKKSP